MHCYIKDSYEQSLSVCRSGCLHSDLTNSELTIPDATQTGIWDQVNLLQGKQELQLCTTSTLWWVGGTDSLISYKVSDNISVVKTPKSTWTKI